MSRCTFCQREFESSQGAKAHLRWCPKYLELKPFKQKLNSSTSSFLPKSEASFEPLTFAPPIGHSASACKETDQATELRRKRDGLLTALCSRLVDWYYPLDTIITKEMAAAAKAAICEELASLRIEELSETELSIRGEAIRNRTLAPYLREQREQSERQRERQRTDALQREQASEAQSRRSKRKAALIELGTTRALESAVAIGLTGRTLVLLEWQVHSRLEIFINGDESEQQVDEHIKAAIERPLLDWKRRVEHGKTIQRERTIERCLTVAMPVMEASIPWIRETLVRNLSDRFGFQPSSPTASAASASPEQSKTTDPPASQQQHGSASKEVAEQAPSPPVDSEAPAIKPKRTATS